MKQLFTGLFVAAKDRKNILKVRCLNKLFLHIPKRWKDNPKTTENCYTSQMEKIGQKDRDRV